MAFTSGGTFPFAHQHIVNNIFLRAPMNAGGQKDGRSQAAEEIETARYIADMTQQMSAMARSADLDVIAYLLEMARLEAEQTVQRGEVKSD